MWCFLYYSFSNIFVMFPPVLEARIQQLQCNVVLDVQHAKVQFMKAPSHGRGTSSGKGHRSTPQEKTDMPKSGQTGDKGSFKSQPRRWIEKLTQEKKNKLKKQQRLQQKMQICVKEKLPTTSSKGTKSSLMSTGTTHKTISTGVKKSRGHSKLSDEIRAAVSSTATTATATAMAGAATVPQKASKKKRKDSKIQKEGTELTGTDPQGTAEELAEVEELEKRLNQQVSHWTLSSKPERMQEGSVGNACQDISLSICSYLEACIFAGDIERAHHFLLSQHRVMSRRKHLNTGVYNIMMRVWAKKVSSEIKFRR